jgi:hypothetical protein
MKESVEDISESQVVDRAQKGRREPENQEIKGESVPVVEANAYHISSSGKIRLDIDRSSLEEAIGHSKDTGMHPIAGRVEGAPSRFDARLSGTKGDYAHVFLDGAAERVAPGQSYKLRVEQVEKDRTFEVARGNKETPYIRVYERVLESLGITCDGSYGVVQFQIRNGKGEMREVYADYNWKTGLMRIPVAEMGARLGDRIEITAGRRYNLEDAVAGFNQQKPESLRNVSMILEKERLLLGVDGRRFEAKDPVLKCYRGKVFLKMRVAEDNLKFQLEGKTVTPRFENSQRIKEFRTIGDTLYAVSYPSKFKTRTDGFVPEKVNAMSYAEMVEWSKGRIRLSSSNHDFQGEHLVTTADEFQSLVRVQLKQAGRRYNVERGNIGEILAWSLCESLGHRIVKDHPFSSNKTHGSTRNGPDFVMRISKTGELHYVEVKNQVDQEAAMAQAGPEVVGFCESRPMYRRERISGAFIVVTDWNGETPTARLYVKGIRCN